MEDRYLEDERHRTSKNLSRYPIKNMCRQNKIQIEKELKNRETFENSMKSENNKDKEKKNTS